VRRLRASACSVRGSLSKRFRRRWFQHRCSFASGNTAASAYGKATAYLPVIELLCGYFEIESRDDPRKIREKVTGKVLTLAPALGSAVPALLALLDVPVDEGSWQALDPLQRRQQTLDASSACCCARARSSR
jgi:hypothetical protein